MKIEGWNDNHQFAVKKGHRYKDLTTKVPIWIPYGAKYFEDCLGTRKEAEEMLLYLQQQRWFAKVLGWMTRPDILLIDLYGYYFCPSVAGKVARMTQNKWGIWLKGDLSYSCRHNLREVIRK